MMKRTFGAPSFARSGSGQAGLETSNVRPMTPGNAVPGLYSRSAMLVLLSCVARMAAAETCHSAAFYAIARPLHGSEGVFTRVNQAETRRAKGRGQRAE